MDTEQVLLKVQPVQKPATGITTLQPAEIAGEQIKIDRGGFEALSAETGAFMEPGWEYAGLLTSGKELASAARALSRFRVIGVDTETSMSPEDKAKAARSGKKGKGDLSKRLCLIQIGAPAQKLLEEVDGVSRTQIDNPEAGRTYLVSAIALENERERGGARTGRDTANPLQPLKALLEDENVIKFEHNGIFEWRQFWKYGIRQQGVVDTLHLSRRFRPDLPSHTLAAVALEVCGILMSKEEQTGEWDAPVYSESQVKYARLDPELTIIVGMALLGWELRANEEVKELRESGDLEQMTAALRDLELERHRLLENSGIAAEDFRLRARVARCEDYLKKELLPRLFEEAQAGAGPDAPEPRIEHESAFGSAYYRRKVIKEPDWEAIQKIDESLPAEVKSLETTKDAIAEAVRRLKEKGVKTPSIESVWKTCREPAGFGEPRLAVSLFDLPAGPDMGEAMRAVVIPEDWGIDDLLCAILEAKLSRARLLRLTGLGNELALIERKKSLISDALLQCLVDRTEADGMIHEKAEELTKAGAVTYKRSRRTAMNFEKLQAEYPDIFALAVREKTTQEAVKQALKARGFDNMSRDALMAELFQPSEEPGSLEARIYPKYGHYYKGGEEEVMDEEELVA